MNTELEQRVQARLDSLTKPQGSLGRLEEIVLRYCLIRGEFMPEMPRKAMYVFCADHGVTAEGVSAFPSEVTRQMVLNFSNGGAAINALCRQFGIEPRIVDVGVNGEPVPGVMLERIANGTANLAREAAMTRAQADAAIDVGRRMARAAAHEFELCGIGEMGIGNTTPVAALLAVFGGVDVEQVAGPGTGLSAEGVRHKTEVIRRALELHRPDPADPVGALALVGGFEIGAMAGFLLEASKLRLPVVVDGFIATSAALVARAIDPGVVNSLFFSHQSNEPAHCLMLSTIGSQAYLNLGMRLGEGSGAALMISLIDASLCTYREMATFEEAAVGAAKIVT